MVQRNLKGVSKKFLECFKEISGKCQGCFKGELSFSDATPIECVPSVRLVGVLVTQDLRWFQNTKFICEKERSKLWILQRMQALELNQF